MVQKLLRLARKNLILVSILAVSLVGRMIAAPFLDGISGGDFFNFLLITKELVSFQNPFIAKRLPFYPLLLIPGHLSRHPIGWAKILGIAAALGSLVVLYLLGRQLKIRKEILYLALIFTSFQPTLFVYSLRPLTHTLFTLEVLVSLYLFSNLVNSDHDRWSFRTHFLFGLTLGIMSMTRHEGFIVAAVLMACWLAATQVQSSKFKVQNHSSKLKTLTTTVAAIVIPFALIVAPYFVSNYLRFGNPIYTDYLTDPGVNRVTNLSQLLANFEKVKWIVLNLWGQTGYFPIKWVLIPSVLVLLAFVFLRERFPKFKLLFWAFLTLFFLSFLTSHFSPPTLLSFFFACAMILGGLKFVIETRWRGVPLLLILATQTVLLLLIQPWARHLQHTFPFWALFLALGLSWIFERGRDKPCHYINSVATVVLSGFVLFSCYGGVKAGITNHQRGVLPAQPLFEAVDFVKDLEGPIAFESDASWVQYYLGDRAVYFAKNLEIPPVDRSFEKPSEEQWAWIQENKPRYLVHYNLWDGFSLVENEEFNDRFQLIKSFGSTRDGEKFTVEVYKVKLPTS